MKVPMPKPPKGFKTCPFCGKPIIVKITASTFNAKAICEDCGVTMSKNYKFDTRVADFIEGLLREDWNMRADHA